MSLKGKRIVVTRAPHQAVILVDELRTRGATPIIFPCIDIAPPDDISRFDAALRNLRDYDWLVLTSSNTVLALRRRIQSLQLHPDLGNMKIAVVGDATAQALEDFIGAVPTVIPDDHSGTGLAARLDLNEDHRVLLPQSTIAPPDLAQALSSQGAQVNVVHAYTTITGHGGENVPEMLDEERIDAVTFTSGSTVTGFLERIAPRQPFHLPVVCIGDSTAAAAREAGFQHVLVGKETTLEAMLDALWTHFEVAG